MAKVPSPWSCDYCGVHKGGANHWWLLLKNSQDLTTGLANIQVFALLPWSDKMADEKDGKEEYLHQHICSESCANKALSQWMGRQKQSAALVITEEKR